MVDTNYVIGLMKEQETVMSVVLDRQILIAECSYSFITRIELLGFFGITLQEIEKIETVLSRMCYLSWSSEIEDAAIAIRRQHRLKLPDAVIAATAKCLDLELLTLDQQLINRMQEI